jgi:hypothetical protein
MTTATAPGPDPLSGTLTWNSGSRAWVGKVRLPPDRTIDFTLAPDDDDLPSLMASIRAQIPRIAEREDRLRLAVAERVARGYDRTRPVAPLERDEIARHLQLIDMTMTAEGIVSLRYRLGRSLPWWTADLVRLVLDRETNIHEVTW